MIAGFGQVCYSPIEEGLIVFLLFLVSSIFSVPDYLTLFGDRDLAMMTSGWLQGY